MQKSNWTTGMILGLCATVLSLGCNSNEEPAEIGEDSDVGEARAEIRQVGAVTTQDCRASALFEVKSRLQALSFVSVDAADLREANASVALIAVDEQGSRRLVRAESLAASAVDQASESAVALDASTEQNSLSIDHVTRVRTGSQTSTLEVESSLQRDHRVTLEVDATEEAATAAISKSEAEQAQAASSESETAAVASIDIRRFLDRTGSDFDLRTSVVDGGKHGKWAGASWDGRFQSALARREIDSALSTSDIVSAERATASSQETSSASASSTAALDVAASEEATSFHTSFTDAESVSANDKIKRRDTMAFANSTESFSLDRNNSEARERFFSKDASRYVAESIEKKFALDASEQESTSVVDFEELESFSAKTFLVEVSFDAIDQAESTTAAASQNVSASSRLANLKFRTGWGDEVFATAAFPTVIPVCD